MENQFEKAVFKLKGAELKHFMVLAEIYIKSRFDPKMTQKQLEDLRGEMWTQTDQFLRIVNRADLIAS